MVRCGFRANSTVVHCTIEKRDTGYGFAEPYFIHEKLLDLVMYYRETTLVEHNEILDVTLKYPVLAAASATMHGPSTPARTVCITHGSLLLSTTQVILLRSAVHSVLQFKIRIVCPRYQIWGGALSNK